MCKIASGFAKKEAEKLKKDIGETFPNREYATVVETLNCDNSNVSGYAQFLFDKDYKLKQ